jgi:hypothetical protein
MASLIEYPVHRVINAPRLGIMFFPKNTTGRSTAFRFRHLPHSGGRMGGGPFSQASHKEGGSILLLLDGRGRAQEPFPPVFYSPQKPIQMESMHTMCTPNKKEVN